MKKVLIIDTRNVIRHGGKSVLIRHTEYASALNQLSEAEFGLLIFDGYGMCSPEEILTDATKVSLKKKNQIHLIWQLISLLRRDKTICLLVSGDPWIPTMICIIAKFFSKSRIPLQIQIHGDIGNKKWRTNSIKNFLKFLVARATLYFATNIRTVGREQSLNLERSFGVNRNLIFVIPVQISFVPEIINSKYFQRDLPTLGFVGRIQKERSYNKLIWILGILAKDGFVFSLKIIGNGPGLQELKRTIETRLPGISATYSGWLEGPDLAIEFNKIDILISTAEFESYGRSIREAEILGIPILASKSSGVIDAKLDSKTNLLHIIEPSDQSKEILEKYKSILNQMTKPSEDNFWKRNSKIDEYQDTSSDLARLWITLSQNYEY